MGTKHNPRSPSSHGEINALIRIQTTQHYSKHRGVPMRSDTEQPVRPLKGSKNILFINPEFPIPSKSKHHKDYLPVGLLKIASWLRSEGFNVQLIYGNQPEAEIDFVPDEVWITSLFTYWSEYVIKSAKHYGSLFESARIVVGGVYATLKSEHCREHTGCDAIQKGVHPFAESYPADYSLLDGDVDFQVVHASRGCIRKCDFCYTYVLEPEYLPATSVLPQIIDVDGQKPRSVNIDSDDYVIKRKGLVFYDNNLLANEYIEEILDELIELKKSRKISWCESQSGFDGRILKETPHLGKKLKQAGFRIPRIAWDWGLSQKDSIKKQIDVLVSGGYQAKDIFVFMIYNWNIPFQEMEQKRIHCFEWGVQISDCRFRPIDQLHDDYSPHKKNQSSEEYHIHVESGWTDALVKQFRRNVRRQNICVRHDLKIYSKQFERKQATPEQIQKVNSTKSVKKKKQLIDDLGYDYWDPCAITFPKIHDEETNTSIQRSLSEFA